jgi:formate transporter
MFILSGQVDAYDGALADYVVKASAEKLSLTYTQNFFQGVFGNFLICSGAWISLAGRSVTDKILGLILPLSAVPALGFQHFTGNLFYKILAFIIAPDTDLIEIGTDITLVNTSREPIGRRPREHRRRRRTDRTGLLLCVHAYEIEPIT